MWIFYPADDSYKMSTLNFSEQYKKKKVKLSSAAVMNSTLRFKYNSREDDN